MSDEYTAGNGRARDSRTLLPDRDSFYRDIQPLLGDAGTQALVLLVIDIEGVDFILRTFGPRERDHLIGEVGQRIQQALTRDTTPYHITQERFALVLSEGTYRHATRCAQSLVDALRQPFDITGIAYYLDAHVGISHYPNHGDTINELVRTSVFACHQARESRTDYATFDRSLDEQERHRFRLMLDLERALQNGREIRLAYQPVVELNSGRCVGVEGLCRWHHPRFGDMSPAHFLPFVEQTALMMPLTEATLGLGMNDLAAWSARGFDGDLTINLSPALFRRSDLLDRLLEHFRFHNTAVERLGLEITETGIMEQPNRAINTLGEIRDRGCRIAVDDFGTGHSSLAYLADLPIDVIKIDMYFVQNLERPWGEAIVSAAATLGHKLGLTTVAEGIEQQAQYHKCRELSVTLGQGYYIGHPMFREELDQWLNM